MKRLLIAVGVLASLAFSTSFAANGGLQAFGTGMVTIGADGTSATIVNASGQYGGVYVQSKSASGLALSALVSAPLSFVSTGFETGGAPRFSIPINTSGAAGGLGSVAGYAFIDAPGCGGSPSATVTVSTASATCGVNFQGIEYTNWSTFAADFPSYRTAQGHFPFIIADEAGSYAVNSIVLS